MILACASAISAAEFSHQKQLLRSGANLECVSGARDLHSLLDIAARTRQQRSLRHARARVHD